MMAVVWQHMKGTSANLSSGKDGVDGPTWQPDSNSHACCYSSCGQPSRPGTAFLHRVTFRQCSRLKGGTNPFQILDGNRNSKPQGFDKTVDLCVKVTRLRLLENPDTHGTRSCCQYLTSKALCDEELAALCQIGRRLVAPFRELSKSLESRTALFGIAVNPSLKHDC